jgi:lysophospholipid acyltransferase (LPLAT)-like uncharacterized protein
MASKEAALKRKGSFLTKLAGLGLTAAVRSWMGTLDFKAVYYDPSVDPCLPTCTRRGIYIFWHEYMPFLMYQRGHCDLAMLISRHRDADVLSRLSLHFGFDFVRGSTRRGGRSALRDLIRKSRTHHLTITPDGPRGPRRRLAAGCVYLAAKLNMPIVAIGLGYDRPWRVNTWDRFAVPRPFSRARAVIGPYMHIPPTIDRDGIDGYRLRVEQLLERLTLEAEAWAEAGTHKENQVPLAPAPRPLPSAADRLLSHFLPRPKRRDHAVRNESRRAA